MSLFVLSPAPCLIVRPYADSSELSYSTIHPTLGTEVVGWAGGLVGPLVGQSSAFLKCTIYSAAQCSATQCSAYQYNAMQCNYQCAIQCSVHFVLYIVWQLSVVTSIECRVVASMQCSAVQYC